MRVLLLVQKNQRAILDRLYDGIAECCDCDRRDLTGEQQADLRGYFRRHVEVGHYERVVLFLRFKKEIRQVGFIRTLPNLVILEHDAYQNYIPCKYTGTFSAYYRKLPWARVISSGYGVCQRLRGEGVDAHFVPKGYDQALLHNRQRERDIELAFVGSLNSVAYAGRTAMLTSIAEAQNLQIMRTASGEEYGEALNRIRFFVSADVGMGEYMIKNFEAMACGCVLLAFDQGHEENQALGFVDMHNVVLYRSREELLQKLAQLRAAPQLGEAIAAAGQALVQERYSFRAIGHAVAASLQAPLRPRGDLNWKEKLRVALGL